MSNIDIKKSIQKYTKHTEPYKISVVLWHGQVGDLSDNFENGIWNEVLIFGENGKLIETDETLYFGKTMYGTDENVKILEKEQNKVYRYLKQHFKNVVKETLTV